MKLQNSRDAFSENPVLAAFKFFRIKRYDATPVVNTAARRSMRIAIQRLRLYDVLAIRIKRSMRWRDSDLKDC